MAVSQNTSARAIEIAKAEVGYREGNDPDGTWNNTEKYAALVPGLAWVSTGGYPWCAVFASWVLTMVGALGKLKPTAAVVNFLQQGRDLGRFTEYPVIGAIAIYGTNEHTGCPVVSYDDTYVYVIEGNTTDSANSNGDGVYLKRRLRRDPWVTGYVIPFYDEFAVSPDPAWNGKWLGLGPAPASPAPAPAPKPTATPTRVAVSLSAVRSAAQHDPARPQGGITMGAADDVRIVEDLLVKAGLMGTQYAHDGSFGTVTVAAYSRWQQRLGYRGPDADGIPGSASLSKLIANYGGGRYVLAK